MDDRRRDVPCWLLTENTRCGRTPLNTVSIWNHPSIPLSKEAAANVRQRHSGGGATEDKKKERNPGIKLRYTLMDYKLTSESVWCQD